jgi:CubicO group peptidase (beta-lactamase class C family)
MKYRAFPLLIALAGLSHLGACAEEKADPQLVRNLNPATRADGGAAKDGGPAATKDGGAGASKDGGGSKTSQLDFTSFDEALDKAIADYNASPAGATQPIKGASAVVVHKDLGLVHSKGYGEFEADRLYLIASASKILSAGVLMRLADEGKLDIDKPISDYLAEAWDEHKTNVTTAQLLSNSSGLPSLPELSAAGASMMPAKLAQYAAHFCQYMPAGKLSDCGKSIYSDETPENNREPDVEFLYGGSQWQLAGAVAEQVSGKSWAELIEEIYVEPCGANSLAYTNQFGARADGSSALTYPKDFEGDVSKLPKSDNPSIEGGAYVTAPDYAKFLLMHLRDGKCDDNEVLSKEAVETMRTDRVAAYGGSPSTNPTMPSPYSEYGLGWWMNDDMIADPGAYGAFPFLDLKRKYGAMIVIEISSTVGGQLAFGTKPKLDAIFDGLAKK